MPIFTILFGIALMVVGIGTFAASNDRPSALLLPIIFGLIALALGVGCIVKKDLKMHLMHGAVLLAAMGVVVPIVQLAVRMVSMWQEQRDKALTLLAVLLTVAISGAYVYTAIQSFRAARKSRKDGATVTSTSPESQVDAPPAE